LTSPPQADGTAKSTKINARDTEIALFVEQPILFCKPLVDMVKKLTIPPQAGGGSSAYNCAIWHYLWRINPPLADLSASGGINIRVHRLKEENSA